MLFGHKNKLQVDLGDLQVEKEHLSSFLQTNFNCPVTPIENRLTVDSDKIKPEELQRAVTKFIYKRNLNNTHYATLENSTVKVSTFKGVEKKSHKDKKNPAHQTAAQSWGL
jgi:hypothetical protein